VAAVRTELLDRFGPMPAPVERLLEVARLRLAAETAGIASISREDRQLVLRFPPGWSRATVMRALEEARRDGLRGLPAGAITFGSNQVRVRVPGGAEAAWGLTRTLVERLAQPSAP
jgi:transcription-repair coupling factor (superfamily II helicase)